MRVRCIKCQRKSDIAEMKPIMFYTHEGDCEMWLREREAFEPSIIWSIGEKVTSLHFVLVVVGFVFGMVVM